MIDRYFSFAEWVSDSSGEYLRQREQAYFDRMVADMFGYNAAQIGLPQLDLLRASRISRHCHVDMSPAGEVQADPLHLPFPSQSLDLLVLPHALEFSVFPHQLLREAERVLIPEGNLLLSGFNPYSLWGVYHRYKQWRGQFPWHGDFVAAGRLRDWLALLSCEVASQMSCCYVPPVVPQRWMSWFERLEVIGEHGWPLGGVYFVHAIKRVQGVRLITPRWSDQVEIAPVLRPATRTMQ